VGLELGVGFQRHVGVAQEREHVLRRRRNLEDPGGTYGCSMSVKNATAILIPVGF
jgi:hypothetical protein